MENFITHLVIHYPILLLVFLIAGIWGIKFGLSRRTKDVPGEERDVLDEGMAGEIPGEEMKISVVATDNRTGKPIYMKIVHPGKILQGRFLEHLDKWLAAVKATCTSEGLDFTLTAKIVLPPSVQRTPEFERLLEQYGLDPEHSIIVGPA